MYRYFFPLFILVSLVACKKSSESPQENFETNYSGPPVKNDWNIAWIGANPQTLNPILRTDAYSTAVIGLIFDSLLAWDAKTGKPKGQLAKSWEISDDGLTYDFYLRKGVKFHDGKPLTAKDIKFSFDLIKNPKIDAAHLQNYYKSLKKTEVINDHQVRFHLSEPYFRHLIMLGLNTIMPEHVYGKGDFNTLPANKAPVGSGPYVFDSWEDGREITLNRNTDWWGLNTEEYKHSYNFERVIFRIIREAAVAALALRKGDIDSMNPDPLQYIRDFKGENFEDRFYKIQYSTPDGNGYRYIGWNMRKDFFKDKKVRHALAKAMPRRKMNKQLYEGLMNLAVGPIPQGSPKIDPNVQPILYDLEGAKKLLEESGWKDTDGDGVRDKDGKKFEFDLLFSAQNEEVEKIALIFQDSLKKLGIQMNLKTLEWTVFIQRLMDNKFDACLLAWGSSLDSDPYQIWHSSQIEGRGSNRVAFANDRVDEILEKARRTLDRNKRNKLYQEFSKIVAEEQPYLFIFERPNLYVATKRFKNVLPIGVLGPDTERFFTPPGLEKYTTATAN